MNGRKGKRRCMQCRIWKRKVCGFQVCLLILQCEYDNISLPCTTCSQKGLDCGVEHKILPSESRALYTSAANRSHFPNALDSEPGDDIDIVLENIPRAPLTPTDHTLSSSDGLYMEFFWCTSATWFDLLNNRITDVEHPLAVCAAHRFGLHISSKLVRSAVLHYSSFRKERELSYLGMQYLAEFYKNAREAIDRESYAELLYACYIMCLNEMACRRKFAGDLEKHANGFILSYQKLVRMSMLTVEESKVMGQAYELIVQMTHVASSRWHQDEHWFDLAKTITQRLGSAASRTLNSAKAITGWKDHSVWIPKSHPLSGAENVVYRLCTLFNRLSGILRSELNGCSFDWDDTAAAVGESLNDLATIIFSQPAIPIPQYYQSHGVFVLNDGVTTLSVDKYTRQLLALYYILLLQYRIMVLEWSDSMWFDTLQTSLAICRLYPSPHQAQYPAPEVRFMTNRGFWVALILVADFHNFRGRNLSVF